MNGVRIRSKVVVRFIAVLRKDQTHRYEMTRESGINANWKATVCPALVLNVPMHVLSFISTRISDNHVDYY